MEEDIGENVSMVGGLVSRAFCLNHLHQGTQSKLLGRKERSKLEESSDAWRSVNYANELSGCVRLLITMEHYNKTPLSSLNSKLIFKMRVPL